jgi:hypothetical protein
MRYIFFFLVLLSQDILFSQNDSANNTLKLYRFLFHDSVKDERNSGFTEIKFEFAGAENKMFLIDSVTYFDNPDSVKSFIKHKNAGGPFSLDKFNFSDSALILVTYRGVDCHSGFDIKLLDDTELKEYRFTVKVIYGGCRAGGRRFLYWYRIPKLPEGYKISYHWYYDKN